MDSASSETSQIDGRPLGGDPLATTDWPLPDRIVVAWFLVMVALDLLGLSFAAVGQVVVDCSRGPIYRTTLDNRIRVTDKGAVRVINQKRFECRTTWGNFNLDIP
jgi:hypothetical protein